MKRFFFVLLIIGGAVNHFYEPRMPLSARSEGERLADLAPLAATEASGMHIVDGTHRLYYSIDDLAEWDIFTVVVFYTETCLACRQLNGGLKQFLEIRPDVAIREVRMPKYWSTDWASSAYGLDIGSTPHVRVYDPQRQLLAKDEGLHKEGYHLLLDWVNTTFQRDFEKRSSAQQQ